MKPCSECAGSCPEGDVLVGERSRSYSLWLTRKRRRKKDVYTCEGRLVLMIIVVFIKDVGGCACVCARPRVNVFFMCKFM